MKTRTPFQETPAYLNTLMTFSKKPSLVLSLWADWPYNAQIPMRTTTEAAISFHLPLCRPVPFLGRRLGLSTSPSLFSPSSTPQYSTSPPSIDGKGSGGGSGLGARFLVKLMVSNSKPPFSSSNPESLEYPTKAFILLLLLSSDFSFVLSLPDSTSSSPVSTGMFLTFWRSVFSRMSCLFFSLSSLSFFSLSDVSFGCLMVAAVSSLRFLRTWKSSWSEDTTPSLELWNYDKSN